MICSSQETHPPQSEISIRLTCLHLDLLFALLARGAGFLCRYVVDLGI